MDKSSQSLIGLTFDSMSINNNIWTLSFSRQRIDPAIIDAQTAFAHISYYGVRNITASGVHRGATIVGIDLFDDCFKIIFEDCEIAISSKYSHVCHF